jgi:molybdenum cofactor cytidylyltransferase
MTARRITGVVLAAGSSRRLGRPKQVLPYRDSTLLGETLQVARGCGFDQLIVTLGGAADQVRQKVSLEGLQTVEVDDPGSGCAGSLKVAIGHVDDDSAGVVLMLGDQPGVTTGTVARLIEQGRGHQMGVCRYTDGIGHPFWLDRSMFDEIALLHGDKAVWKLIDSGRFDVTQVVVDGPVPQDVDTWEDYERLLAVSP